MVTEYQWTSPRLLTLVDYMLHKAPCWTIHKYEAYCIMINLNGSLLSNTGLINQKNSLIYTIGSSSTKFIFVSVLNRHIDHQIQDKVDESLRKAFIEHVGNSHRENIDELEGKSCKGLFVS